LSCYNIPNNYHLSQFPEVWLVFVRDEYVEGTSINSSQFKCLGLMGVKSIVSTTSRSQSNEYESQLSECILSFDYIISKKEMINSFGNNVMKCKKNKYGFSLCA